MPEGLTFTAEIKQVSSKKTASLDIVYKLVLETNDASVLGLGALSPESLFKVTVQNEV